MTMRKNTMTATALALLLAFGLLGSPSVGAQSGGLVNLLSGNLGVTAPQAEGGAGAIFSYAKQRLSPDEFTKVASAVPEMDSLLKAAPQTQTSGLGKALGGTSSMLGGGTAKVGGLASVGDNFSKLGMQPDMVNKFVPTILQYVESNGGATTKSILAAVLK
jgi:Protein of unknown function VcgC/VcgE (DUF2780)